MPPNHATTRPRVVSQIVGAGAAATPNPPVIPAAARKVLGGLDPILDQDSEATPPLELNRWEASRILGQCRTALGELPEGEIELRRALEWAESLAEGGTQEAEARFALGVNLCEQRRFEEAEFELEAGYRDLLGSPLESPEQARALIELYERWEKPAEAARYRSLLETARRGPAAFR